MTALETAFAIHTPMHKCDGCPARAKVRMQAWDEWPHFLDLCRHHANKAIQTYPHAILIEERD